MLGKRIDILHGARSDVVSVQISKSSMKELLLVHFLRAFITMRSPERENVHLASMTMLINKLNAMDEKFKDH